MNSTPNFNILQYNVRNERESVMLPLLADKETGKYQVLAIQEPWKNTRNFSSYNPSSSRFHLAGSAEGDMRVCFYINKEIDPESWKITYHTKDACTLTINTKPKRVEPRSENNGEEIDDRWDGILQIHNVYNPSPISYN